MKLPEIPPNTNDLLKELSQTKPFDTARWTLLHSGKATDYKDRYLHWDDLRFKKPPEKLDPIDYWYATKHARKLILKELTYKDINAKPFMFSTPDIVLKMLHRIDKKTLGNIQAPDPVTNPKTKDVYLINSLIEEAIHSSQLEGAATTRKAAKEMIRTERAPRNKSEQMIYNNYEAMQYISTHKDDDLTPAMIFELHRIVTYKTLEDETKAGKLRSDSDDIVVKDFEGNTLHTPPKESELKQRLDKLCDFANSDNSSSEIFIHPVVRAILVHFMFGYDHPFVDGNGRTARALFYWVMAKQGYWLTEYISISRILNDAKTQYARSYLLTETDDNDATYFIVYQLEVIIRAIDDLYSYLEKKVQNNAKASQLLSNKLKNKLNHRQIDVLEHGLNNPRSIYRIKEHQNKYRVTYQTARTDLLELSDALKLLDKLKEKRSFVFLAPLDLLQRIERAA